MIRVCILSVLVLYFLSGCAAKDKAAPQPVAQTPAATAPKAKEEKKFGTICTQGTDKRVIEVVRLPERTVSSGSNKICEVIYSKFSKSESVASSVKSLDHCESVSKKIRSNLESNGFRCEI